MESLSGFISQHFFWYVLGFTALSGAITWRLRYRPIVFWRKVDLWWIGTFVGSVIIVLFTFQEQEQKRQLEAFAREAANDNRGLIENINQIDCFTYEGKERENRIEWQAVCQILNKLSSAILVKGLSAGAVIDGIAKQNLDREKFRPFTEPHHIAAHAQIQNTIIDLGYAVNQLLGIDIFDENIQTGILNEQGFSWESTSQFGENQTLIHLDNGKVVVLSEQERRVAFIVERFHLWFLHQEEVVWSLPNKPTSWSSTLQPFILLIACLVFPFRVGKSLYEIKNSKPSTTKAEG